MMFILTGFSCLFFVIGLVNSVIIEVKEQNTTIKPTEKETPDNDCNVDPCLTMGKKCENDGECVTDPLSCKWKCECAKGYYGRRCQYESDKRNAHAEKENRNLKSSTPRTSPVACSGQVCLHGECVSAPFGTTSCQCNDGWFGANCGTFGSVIDDDFLKSLTESFHEKLSKVEKKNRLHTEEGDKHPKKLSGLIINQSNVFGKLINNSKQGVTSKKNDTDFEIKKTERPLQNKRVETKDSLENPENETEIEYSLHAKYNVCNEESLERTEDERTCENAKGMKCVHGVCNETLIDHGTWKGYNTTCTCDFGARGMFCENKCCLDCGENGKCDMRIEGDNITEICNCRRQYTGFFCEIYQPDPVSIQIKEDKWYMWVVGVCVATFVILVTLAIVGPYFMWKHRVILVMKIVHYFHAYEDDDEKEWDAFVSYKSHPTDENFVVRVLYPKLEKELGFKLCLHFRDFVPGETISNNIINAVEGSRRTILVLTPRYVESEFTRFEYQKAQTEMLKRKHRIIPIMLEDISDVSDIDKNLKGIIGSVTYLEWPGTDDSSNNSKKLEKFWKRLQLSLPKKKVTDYEKSAFSLESPPVSSFNPSGTDISLSSDSGFKESLTSDRSRGSTSSECIDNWWVSDSTYAQISDVFFDDISETVQPLTEEEELELIAKGSTANVNDDKLIYDYAEVDSDQYKGLEQEDNQRSEKLMREMRPSVQKIGKEENNLQARIVKKVLPENYIEFEIEENSRPENILKKGLPDKYIELEAEENTRPERILKKDLPENYVEFELDKTEQPTSIVKNNLPDNYIEFKVKDASQNNIRQESPENYVEFSLESSLSSFVSADELPENYIEFKAEDNPPSPSLLQKKKPVVQLDIDDYIEVDV